MLSIFHKALEGGWVEREMAHFRAGRSNFQTPIQRKYWQITAKNGLSLLESLHMRRFIEQGLLECLAGRVKIWIAVPAYVRTHPLIGSIRNL